MNYKEMTPLEQEEQDLKQQIIAELEDISPGLMKDVLKTIRAEKALEDEEDERESQIAMEEAIRLGTTPLEEFEAQLDKSA